MNAHRPRRLCAVIAFVSIGIVSTIGVPLHAEVGIPVEPGLGGGTGPYIFGITDDPDPFGYWLRLSSPTSGRAILNEAGAANGDGPPSIAYDPAHGVILVAWAKAVAGGFDIVASRFVDGAWTAPQTIAGSPANELDPSLFLGPNGEVHVVYWLDDGVTRRVEARSASPDLAAWSAPEPVSEAGEMACRPTGVVFEGVLRVAYEVHDFGFGETPRRVVLARRDGSSFVREVVAVTNNAGPVAPRVGAHAGRLWVDWIDAETATGAGEIAWTSFEASSGWGPLRYEGFGSAADREFHVRPGLRLRVWAP